ncbi:MAG: PIN domain nuclease [gamma proteobacterium symbiont of Bathyaustriella thionipta]|nr:PIN domain nuclease [gamma proteobacterium symbiont of Bathyaustriella thionipta]
MILVDSSVWIDYFNGVENTATNTLDEKLGLEKIAIGDLILTEVLQGFRSDADYKAAKNVLTSLTLYNLLNTELAIKSADHFRKLRKKEITIRKTVDVIIATYCIENKLPLLFIDRDFIPFVEHLKLRSVI